MRCKIKQQLKALSYIVFVCLLILMAACSRNVEEPESGSLVIGMLTESKVMDVRTNWLDAFLHQNKEIDAEYVSLIPISDEMNLQPGSINVSEKIAELLDGPNPPDVVALGYEDFQEAVAQNLLAPLDPMMQGSSLTADRLQPSVLAHFRGADGQLYGLAPVIQSSALVYNKALFDRANISYPTDGMTWEEMFELAKQVAHKDGSDTVYGFTFGNRYEFPALDDVLYWYGAGSGLKIHDDRQMLINNAEWRSLFDTLFKLLMDGVYPFEEPGDSVQKNPFYSGDVAMAVMRDRDLYEWMHFLENADSEEGFIPFDWDIVTVPVHEHARDQGAGISFEPIFAISANAASPKTAWKLLEFMHSDQWVKMSINKNHLLTFDHTGESFGMSYNRDALFELRPVEQPIIRTGSFSRNTYYQDVIGIGRRFVGMMIMMNAMTVEELLQQWEAEGNRLLQQKQ